MLDWKQTKKHYIERLSSGKVYAVHLFVLVSSVKIFAYHNRKSVQKKHQRPKKAHHPPVLPRKKLFHEQTFTLSVVCIPQKSQLNKMFENFIFPGAMNTVLSIPFPICRYGHRHHLLRSFDISTRIDLFESLSFSQQFHISVFPFCYRCCHILDIFPTEMYTKINFWNMKSGKIEILCNSIR